MTVQQLQDEIARKRQAVAKEVAEIRKLQRELKEHPTTLEADLAKWSTVLTESKYFDECPEFRATIKVMFETGEIVEIEPEIREEEPSEWRWTYDLKDGSTISLFRSEDANHIVHSLHDETKTDSMRIVYPDEWPRFCSEAELMATVPRWAWPALRLFQLDLFADASRRVKAAKEGCCKDACMCGHHHVES